MRKYTTTLAAEIRMNIVELMSYRFSFITDIAIMLGLYSIIIYTDSGYRLTQYYSTAMDQNPQTKTLILLGYVSWILCNHGLTVITSGIRTEAIKGTLEQKFTAIVPFWWLLFSDTLSSVLVSLGEIVVIMLIAGLIFHTPFFFPLSVIPSIMVSFVGMYGIFLIIGALTLRKKKIGQLVLIIQVLLLFISNVFTMVELPWYSSILPLGLGNHIVRLIFLHQEVPIATILFHLGTSFGWLFIGILVFRHAITVIRQKGTIGQY
ncbi:MAG: hypothetical protein ACQ5SW_04750 [Sphaerochaetaceae bacterium]